MTTSCHRFKQKRKVPEVREKTRKYEKATKGGGIDAESNVGLIKSI